MHGKARVGRVRVPTFGRNLKTKKRLKSTALPIKGNRIASCGITRPTVLRQGVAGPHGDLSRSVRCVIAHVEDKSFNAP